MPSPTTVYLEIGGKRIFAGAVEWPGWSRSGRSEEQALEALAGYLPRYAAVLAPAGIEPPDDADVEVIERVPGNATTDFGAPGIPPAADERPLDDEELGRQQAILAAAWRALARAAERASGIELRKGPRGGGRELEKIVAHVVEAEASYLAQVGAKVPPGGDPREAMLHALAARSRGETPVLPSRVRKLWTPRYAVRRAAWHVLDHAWEIEDRSGTAG